jgi:hypothetical protein
VVDDVDNDHLPTLLRMRCQRFPRLSLDFEYRTADDDDDDIFRKSHSTPNYDETAHTSKLHVRMWCGERIGQHLHSCAVDDWEAVSPTPSMFRIAGSLALCSYAKNCCRKSTS